MNYLIDRSIGKKAYIQIYMGLRDDITLGVLKSGEKLPSKRMLALETGTSIITVQHAYELLLDEGYIESRERSGYYVCYQKDETFPVGETHEDQSAAVYQENSEQTFPFSVYARAMRKVITQYGQDIMLKTPYCGSERLRTAISRYLARSRSIFVSPEQILIGSGAEYLYGMVVQILGHDMGYAIESPSYRKIKAVYERNDVTVEELRLGKDGILTKDLKKSKARVLHVTPFNSFPSGITASASKRHEYIMWASERDGVIVEDDFDSEFSMSTKVEDTLFSLEPDHTVIYMNTFSKTISPSVRMGYMVLPASCAEEMKKKIELYSCTVPLFEQLVLSELIESGDFERHINRVRRRRRQAEMERDKQR